MIRRPPRSTLFPYTNALPIFLAGKFADFGCSVLLRLLELLLHLFRRLRLDRKSTRLNSSHSQISYAVFCLKKKKKPFLRLLLNLAHRSMSCSLSGMSYADVDY